MNFPIKYRGRRIDNGDWFYGYYARVTKTVDEEDGYVDVIIDELGVEFEVDADTVGMFTGLFDINNQEIYTGMIVEWFELRSIVDIETGSFTGRPEVHSIKRIIKNAAVVEFVDGRFDINGCGLYNINQRQQSILQEDFEEAIKNSIEYKEITYNDLYKLKIVDV